MRDLAPREMTGTPQSVEPSGGSVPNMESRLVDLEVRYTHLERQVAELSEVVFMQQRAIDGLLRQLSSTQAELAQLNAPVTNEKPPHY